MGSIGVIGGADGPTAIFIASPPDGWIWLLLLLAAAAAAGIGIWLFLRRRKK